MIPAPARRAVRAMELLHQRLQHFPHYYATTCEIRATPPEIIVFVNQHEEDLKAVAPSTWYGFPVRIKITDRLRPRSDGRHVPVPNDPETDIEQAILDGFNAWTHARTTRDGTYIITTPFWDSMSDPVTLAIRTTNKGYKVSDAGAVACHLFSNDQHQEGTPGYRLVTRLAAAHEFEIDHQQGEIYLECDPMSLYDTVAEMTKIVLVMLTAAQHLEDRT